MCSVLKVFFYISSYLTEDTDQLFLRPQRLLAVPWLRRSEFDPRSAHVKFVVDKVVLRWGFLRVLRFFPVSAIPSIFLTHLHLHVALRIFQKKKTMLFWKLGTIGWERTCTFYGAHLIENSLILYPNHANPGLTSRVTMGTKSWHSHSDKGVKTWSRHGTV